MIRLFMKMIKLRRRKAPANPAMNDECCAICHERVGDKSSEEACETWRFLPCGHRFGSKCLLRWLGTEARPNCPLCRHILCYEGCLHPFLPTTYPETAGYQTDIEVSGYCIPGYCRFCTDTGAQRYYIFRQVLQKLNSVLGSIDPSTVRPLTEEAIAARIAVTQDEIDAEWRLWWDMQIAEEDRASSTA